MLGSFWSVYEKGLLKTEQLLSIDFIHCAYEGNSNLFFSFFFILYFTVARVISIQTHSHKMLHIGNKAECITHHRWFRCANKLKARIFFISISRKFHRYGNHLYGISDKQKHKKRSNTSSSSTLPMMYHGITVHLIA